MFIKFFFVLTIVLSLPAKAAQPIPGVQEAVPQDSDAAFSLKHREAIELARKGEKKVSLTKIEKLAEEYGWKDEILYDYLVVLVWDERYQDAYNHYQKRVKNKKNIDNIPLYVLKEAAKAAQECNAHSDAIFLYKKIIEKGEKAAGYYVGLASIYRKMENFPEAIYILHEAEKFDPLNIEVLKLLEHSYTKINRHSTALHYENIILNQWPMDRDTIRNKVFTLVEMKAAYQAFKILSENPLLFSEEETQNIEKEKVAIEINWGVDSSTEEDRKYYFDRAIESLRRLIHKSHDPNFIEKARFDLILALNKRGLHKEVILEFESNLAPQKTLAEFPTYVLAPLVDSYINERKLIDAKSVFDVLLRRKDLDRDKDIQIETIQGYFFCLLESEEIDRALDYANAVRSYIKYDMEEFYPSALYYAGLNAAAQKQTEAAIAEAPQNITLRKLMGDVYAARGLPRKAMMEYDIGLTTAPDDVSLLVGKAEVLMTLHHPDEAERIINDLHAKYPDSSSVKKLVNNWNARNTMEFDASYEYEKSNKTVVGNGVSTLKSYLYSRPFLNHFRAFLGSTYLFGKFAEGSLYFFSKSVGLQQKSENISSSIELKNMRFRGIEKNGANIQVEVTPTDEISIEGRTDINSSDTPGRGLTNYVMSNYFEARSTYTKNDHLKVSLFTFVQKFTDKNIWHGGGGYIQKRLIEQPRYFVDLRLDMGARKSKTDDVYYFSPIKDFSTSLSPIFQQIIYRDYEFSLTHRITPSVTRYWQKGYGTNSLWGISYEHIWAKTNVFTFGYGGRYRKAIYDGARENSIDVFLNFNMRF